MDRSPDHVFLVLVGWMAHPASIPRNEICPERTTMTTEPESFLTSCPHCKGEGSRNRDEHGTPIPCPNCNGIGVVKAVPVSKS